MKFYLVGGEVKFITHKLEWQETRKQYNQETKKMEDVVEDKSQEFWNDYQKTALINKLAEREITPTITAIDQPTVGLLSKCQGRIFNTYDEALDFVVADGVAPLTKEEALQEQIDTLALEILTLKGI